MYLPRLPHQLALFGSLVFGVNFSVYSARVGRSAGGVGRYPGRMWKRMAWSVAPWTLDSPRSAFTPPPARPTLPRRSWIIAIVRMFWVPTVCWVQPIAYISVPTRSDLPVEA